MTSLANAQLLTTRRSQKLVQAPGPNVEQLQQMLAAAVCAPDHSALRAWRFALVMQPEVAAFTDLAIAATRRSGREPGLGISVVRRTE